MTRKRHFTHKRGGAQGKTPPKELELVHMQHEKWLLLGITHTEMEERKYNDPTNGGEMITFDYGRDNYDGGDDKKPSEDATPAVEGIIKPGIFNDFAIECACIGPAPPYANK